MTFALSRIPNYERGADFLDRALAIRDSAGVESAAVFGEAWGMPRELLILALVGAPRAESYGVNVGHWQGARRCN